MSGRIAWVSDRLSGRWHQTNDANVVPPRTLCGRSVYAPDVRDDRPTAGTFCDVCEAWGKTA